MTTLLSIYCLGVVITALMNGSDFAEHMDAQAQGERLMQQEIEFIGMLIGAALWPILVFTLTGAVMRTLARGARRARERKP